MAVEFDLEELAWLVGRGGGVQLVTDHDPLEASVMLKAAAADVEQRYDEDDEDGLDVVGTYNYSFAPGGPTCYFTVCDNADLLAIWMGDVAVALERAGISGVFRGLKDLEPPELSSPRVSAVIALELDWPTIVASPEDLGHPDIRWWVTPERTSRVLPTLVAWCLDTPGEVYLRTSVGMRITPDQALPVLSAAVPHAPGGRLQRTTADLRTQRTLTLHEGGGVIISSWGPDRPWRDHLDDVQEPLRYVAAEASHAFVRVMPVITASNDAWRLPPMTPFVAQRAGQFRGRMINGSLRVAYLLADYVPDAYAQQVLSTRHIKGLADRPLPPDRWSIEPLGHDRHLVTATDPGPWLDVDPTPYTNSDHVYIRTPVPDPTTLARARDDFAPLIVTPRTVEENPSPRPVLT